MASAMISRGVCEADRSLMRMAALPALSIVASASSLAARSSSTSWVVWS